jgi:hypothetical protein
MSVKLFLKEKLNITTLGLSKHQKIVLFVTLLFFYFFFFISSSGRNGSNDGGHIALASSIYFDHQLSIKKYEWKYVTAPDYAIKDSVMYSDRLPGTALLTIPFLGYSHALKKILPKKTASKSDYFYISATLLPNLAGVAGLFLLFLLSYHLFSFDYRLSLAMVIICGLATLYQLESTHIYSHIISLVGITFAVYLAVLARNWKNWNWTLYSIAAIIGFFTLVELQNILSIVPIFFYLMITNNLPLLKLKTYVNKQTIITACILLFFLGLLLCYNYITFGEFFLKSNKYNPFFEEEKTFLTALSGNFFEGLDNLITSFNNLPSYLDWSLAVNNGTPGVLIANPVFIFSFLGFIPFYKKHKREALLFLSLIIISILIAAFHVTTLVRHIFTIHVLLYFPIIFFIDWIKTQSITLRAFLYGSVTIITLLSFVKEIYLNNHYWGRNYDFTHFEYLQHLDVFVYLNLPVFLLIGIYLFIKRRRTSSFTV